MAKKYYAYFISDNRQSGVTESWSECEKFVSGVKGARFRGFGNKKDAEEWLLAGAAYTANVKKVRDNSPLGRGIYFDAGTGRGLGFVEVNVADEKGKSKLSKILEPKYITKFGTYVIANRNATNNYGELLAMRFALAIAEKEGIKKVFGDSRLVIDYWSKGRIKKGLQMSVYPLAEEVRKMRESFENKGGAVMYVSGDRNPADLGFHR